MGLNFEVTTGNVYLSLELHRVSFPASEKVFLWKKRSVRAEERWRLREEQTIENFRLEPWSSGYGKRLRF